MDNINQPSTMLFNENTVDLKSYFKKVYDDEVWLTNEYSDVALSGAGSSKSITTNLCNELATIIQQYNIKNIVDCGCGSFNYLIPLVDFLHKNINSYIGIDIVDHIIDDNKKYSNNKFNFIIDDICSTDKIQNADLVICKEVLMHISTKLINDFFRNLKNRNVKYVLISSFRNEKSPPRVDGVSGLGVLFKINLFTNPYNFGGPLAVITESDVSDDAKLYMWKVSELPDL
jgi:SAM-dependent methyltransferase